MDIPAALIREMEKGNVVLFLGAGANVGAKLDNNGKPPLGKDLKIKLCDEFLSSKYKEESLAWVSELAISQISLNTVQKFIAEIFASIVPAEFHSIIPKFRWRGIATTNYDKLIEKIYYKSDANIQEVVPFISDKDRIDEKLRAPNHVAYLKLHGCISIIDDPKLPLILTTDQYADYRTGRNRPFRTLEEWGTENTIVFVGHKVQDLNLRAILLHLTKEIDIRNRYYMIEPKPDSEIVSFWESKKISVIDGTFKDFLTELDQEIPEAKRPLLKIRENTHPIKKHYKVSKDLTESIEFLLNKDVEYVYDTMSIKDGNPKRFYKGFALDWYPISQNLDVRRNTLTDKMLYDVFLKQENDRPTISELYLLKAEAGAGKSVFLKRLAWKASRDANCLCLFANQYGSPSIEALQELHSNTKERIFLFVDNSTDNINSIKKLLIKSRNIDLPTVAS